MELEPYFPLVHSLARRFPYHVCDPEDLFQQGCVGLVTAAKRYEPERGVRFSTYAVPFILGEMRRLCSAAGPVHVPRPEREARVRLRRAAQTLMAEKHREPTVTELADAMRMDAGEVSLLLEDISAVPMEAVAESGREDIGLAVADALCGLPERTRQLLVLRYLRGMTQQEIAGQLGVSQMEVSRQLRRCVQEEQEKAGSGPDG